MMNAQEADAETGNDKEDVFNILKLYYDIDVPLQLRNILKYTAFDNETNLKNLTEDDIKQIEEFVRNDLEYIADVNEENSKYFYGFFKFQNRKQFKLLPGQKKLLCNITTVLKTNVRPPKTPNASKESESKETAIEAKYVLQLVNNYINNSQFSEHSSLIALRENFRVKLMKTKNGDNTDVGGAKIQCKYCPKEIVCSKQPVYKNENSASTGGESSGKTPGKTAEVKGSKWCMSNFYRHLKKHFESNAQYQEGFFNLGSPYNNSPDSMSQVEFPEIKNEREEDEAYKHYHHYQE